MKKYLHAAAGLLFVLPLVFLAIAWPSLPAAMPVHFSINGTADGYGSKSIFAAVQILLSAVNAAIYLAMSFSYRFDRKTTAFENKARMQRMAVAIAVFVAAMQLWILYAAYSGRPGSVNLIFIGVGLLFAIMGNYMYHIRPNRFAGFRVSWTLKHPDNWRKTHQLAGSLWFGGGLLIALCSTLLPFRTSIFLVVAIALVMLVVPGIYSYRYYKRHNA